MVDATFGGGPPNSNISIFQCSGQYLSGVFVAQYPSGGGLISGVSGTMTLYGQYTSGTYTANTPRSESSWNV